MTRRTVRGMPLPRLHLLTDTLLQSRYSHLELVQMAVAAGADAVQVREKRWAAPEVSDELMAIVAAAKPTRTQIIINDWVQLAAQSQADGVHVGQEDTAAATARDSMVLDRWVGLTVHTLAELQQVDPLVVDYIGVGPVFGTQSKRVPYPPLGLDGLARMCNLSPVPVIAIGAIGAAQLPAVLAAGAYGAAVLSAFCTHADPYAAACDMQRLVDACPRPH